MFAPASPLVGNNSRPLISKCMLPKSRRRSRTRRHARRSLLKRAANPGHADVANRFCPNRSRLCPGLRYDALGARVHPVPVCPVAHQGFSFQPRTKPTPRHQSAAVPGFSRAYSVIVVVMSRTSRSPCGAGELRRVTVADSSRRDSVAGSPRRRTPLGVVLTVGTVYLLTLGQVNVATLGKTHLRAVMSCPASVRPATDRYLAARQLAPRQRVGEQVLQTVEQLPAERFAVRLPRAAGRLQQHGHANA